MSRTAIGWFSLFLLLGFALADPAQAVEAAPHASAIQVFDYVITQRKISHGPTTLRAVQGDTIELRFTSDEPLLVHVHGYNAEARLQPGVSVALRIAAYASGRFPVEAHPLNPAAENAAHRHGITLLYVEIYPR